MKAFLLIVLALFAGVLMLSGSLGLEVAGGLLALSILAGMIRSWVHK